VASAEGATEIKIMPALAAPVTLSFQDCILNLLCYTFRGTPEVDYFSALKSATAVVISGLGADERSGSWAYGTKRGVRSGEWCLSFK